MHGAPQTNSEMSVINDVSFFLSQIYAINKRSYETARHTLVIKITAGTGDLYHKFIVQLNQEVQ